MLNEELEARLKERTAQVYALMDALRANADTLSEKHRTAEAAGADRSRFVADIGHQIQTPMQRLIDLVNRLLDTPLTAEQHQYAEQIRSSSQALLTLISDFSAFSETTTSEPPKHSAPAQIALPALQNRRVLIVDDNAAFRTLAMTYLRSWRCRAAEAGNYTEALHLLRAEMSAGAPFDVALLDRRLPDINGVLLAEVIKTDPMLASTHLVLLTGQDSTTELAMDERALFAFCTHKPLNPDTLHAALLSLFSAHNNVPHHAAPVGQSATCPRTTVKQTRILIAEDNLMNQKVSLLLLKRLGYAADAVANGAEALAALRQTPYSLVLMDCNMPEMDGFDATSAIRSGNADVITPEIPIIALTADVRPECREKCLAVGMNDYLAKPVNAAALEAVLAQWLEKAHALL